MTIKAMQDTDTNEAEFAAFVHDLTYGQGIIQKMTNCFDGRGWHYVYLSKEMNEYAKVTVAKGQWLVCDEEGELYSLDDEDFKIMYGENKGNQQMAWIILIEPDDRFERINDKHIEPFSVFGVDWFSYDGQLYAKTPYGALCVADKLRDSESFKDSLVKMGASVLSEQVKRYARLFKLKRGYDASIWLSTKLIGSDK
jgi:hypothetical protein